MHTHLMLVEHLPEVLIARMLIEPSSTARQNVIISWLHFHWICFVCCISSGFVWLSPTMKGGDLFWVAVYFADSGQRRGRALLSSGRFSLNQKCGRVLTFETFQTFYLLSLNYTWSRYHLSRPDKDKLPLNKLSFQMPSSSVPGEFYSSVSSHTVDTNWGFESGHEASSTYLSLLETCELRLRRGLQTKRIAYRNYVTIVVGDGSKKI